MPTEKASGLPKKPGPIHPLVSPKNTLRTRLIKSFLRDGLIGLIRLIGPLAQIWIDKFAVEVQSRLPFAYRRWQIDFEKGRAEPLPSTATASKIAFVYPSRMDDHSLILEKQTPPYVLSVFHSLQNVQPKANARFIQAENEGEFLSLCHELAVNEGIEWLVFTHQQAVLDDQLTPGIRAIDANTDCVYWDEDHLSGKGSRQDPFFKPAWSPELWLHVDILDTFALRTRSFSRSLPQPSFALFKARVAETQKPLHISKVWTHLRSFGSKEAQFHRAQHAESVSSYLQNLGMENVAVRNEGDGLRTDWAVKTEKVSIVIPSRNNLRYLQRCLETLVNRTAYPDYEIFVVDNHSTDEAVLGYYTHLLENNKNIRVLPYDSPFNFSQACNLGAAAATGSLLLFLNNDVEIIEGGWLDELVRVVQLPGVGIAGARLTYPDGSLQHAGIVVGMTGHANHVGIKSKAWGKGPYGPANVRRNVSAVTGACMMVRSDVFLALHGFSENYKLVFNDVDICVRAIQAGWRVVMTPFANLIHYEGRSRSRTIPPEDIQLAYQDIARWVEIGDPYYNLNLSLAITRPVFRSRSEMSSLRRLQTITMILGGEGS